MFWAWTGIRIACRNIGPIFRLSIKQMKWPTVPLQWVASSEYQGNWDQGNGNMYVPCFGVDTGISVVVVVVVVVHDRILHCSKECGMDRVRQASPAAEPVRLQTHSTLLWRWPMPHSTLHCKEIKNIYNFYNFNYYFQSVCKRVIFLKPLERCQWKSNLFYGPWQNLSRSKNHVVKKGHFQNKFSE